MSQVETLRLVVNRRALVRACARAAEQGVARGGRYDVRGSALVIWPEPWSALPLKPRGEPIGMISWEWSRPDEPFATVTRVEAAEGHSPQEVLAHLHRLLNPGRPLGPGEEYGA
jgi:hypothetical protein